MLSELSLNSQLALSLCTPKDRHYTGTTQEANTFFKGTLCSPNIPQGPDGTPLLLYVPITGLKEVASGLLEKEKKRAQHTTGARVGPGLEHRPTTGLKTVTAGLC